MARILPDKFVPGFLESYGVDSLTKTCNVDQLTVKIWDKYGKKPIEGEEQATGSFIAAIVICDDCGKALHIDDDRVTGTPSRTMKKHMPRPSETWPFWFIIKAAPCRHSALAQKPYANCYSWHWP